MGNKFKKIQGCLIYYAEAIPPLPFFFLHLSFPLSHSLTMRIMVAVKRVVDYAVKVRVAADKKSVDLTSVKMSLNPFW